MTQGKHGGGKSGYCSGPSNNVDEKIQWLNFKCTSLQVNMSPKREETRNDTDSEFEDYINRYYKDLKDGRDIVQISDETFMCPYCYDSDDEKKQYAFHEIVIHASRLGRESMSASYRSKERHLGLERYLMSYFDEKTKTSQSRTEHLIEKENKIKDMKLEGNVTDALSLEEKQCEEVRKNICSIEKYFSYVMRQKEDMENAYNKELQMKREQHNKNLERISLEYEQTKSKLEAEETMMKLAEAHKKQMDQLRQKIVELEKKINEKQRLELIKSIEEKLKEKADEVANLEELNQALVIKERKTNDELQDTRKELVNGLKDRSSVNAIVGVKRMGDLDGKPILAAAKRKYPAAEAGERAMEFASQLNAKLRDPSWYPFKVIMVNEHPKEVIDEEDDCLKTIKSDWDDEVYKAVIRALSEANEYNPSGRYPVPELWNFREGKRATLGDCVDFILRVWKRNKRKKNDY